MAQNLTYTQCGDYYIPDIRLAHTGTHPLGKYGRMRRVISVGGNVYRLGILKRRYIVRISSQEQAPRLLRFIH